MDAFFILYRNLPFRLDASLGHGPTMPKGQDGSQRQKIAIIPYFYPPKKWYDDRDSENLRPCTH